MMRVATSLLVLLFAGECKSECPTQFGLNRRTCASPDGSGSHGYAGSGRICLGGGNCGPGLTEAQCLQACACVASRWGGCCEVRTRGRCNFKINGTVVYSGGHTDTKSVTCTRLQDTSNCLTRSPSGTPTVSPTAPTISPTIQPSRDCTNLVPSCPDQLINAQNNRWTCASADGSGTHGWSGSDRVCLGFGCYPGAPALTEAACVAACQQEMNRECEPGCCEYRNGGRCLYKPRGLLYRSVNHGDTFSMNCSMVPPPTAPMPTVMPTASPMFHPCTDGTHDCMLGTTYCAANTQIPQGWTCECRPGLTRVDSTSCAIPTRAPSSTPTIFPTISVPTRVPTDYPTATFRPTRARTSRPTAATTFRPTGATSRPTSSGNSNPQFDPNTGEKDSGSSSSTTIIVVAIIALLVVAAVVLLAVVIVKKAKKQHVAGAFENPMYDSSMPDVNEQPSSGYMDVPAGDGDYDTPTGYMDVGPDGDDDI